MLTKKFRIDNNDDKSRINILEGVMRSRNYTTKSQLGGEASASNMVWIS
jgi:hypothetical protein